MKYIICYDIAQPKRLVRISKSLEKKGYRIQKSFFSCLLSSEILNEVKEYLETVISLEEDKIAIYPICDKCINNGYYIGCNAADFFEKEFFIL